jgi:biotin carboxyl carrier protein
MKIAIEVGDESFELSVEQIAPQRYQVIFDGEEPMVVDAVRLEANVMSLLLDGRSYEIGVHKAGGRQTSSEGVFDVLGTPHAVQAADPRKKALRMADASASGDISTSMPGRVVRLLVAVGDQVSAGQAVVVVEAMKMENELQAPIDGRIDAIHVAAGDTVEANALLVSIGDDD